MVISFNVLVCILIIKVCCKGILDFYPAENSSGVGFINGGHLFNDFQEIYLVLYGSDDVLEPTPLIPSIFCDLIHIGLRALDPLHGLLNGRKSKSKEEHEDDTD